MKYPDPVWSVFKDVAGGALLLLCILFLLARVLL